MVIKSCSHMPSAFSVTVQKSCGTSQYGIHQEHREGREIVVCEQKVIRHQWQKIPVPGNHSACGLSILTTHSHNDILTR